MSTLHSVRVAAVALLACSALALVACAGHRARRAPVTIGDLAAQSDVPVQTGAPMPGPRAAEAMGNYQQFLQLNNADPVLRAEAMRRLGDLNLESGELERMTSEVTRLDAHGAEAIQLYTTLLKAYPNYPHNDQVLYQLARAYDTTGQQALALATLDRIVAEYPHDPEIGEVQFRRGELLFSLQRYPEAQHAYEAVLALGRDGTKFYPQSLYKRGWAQFKLGLNADCLQSFADLLDYTLLDPAHPAQVRSMDALGRADRELVDDTLRVASISLSYLDGAQSIPELAAHRGRMPYAWLLYQRLGDLYVSKQRYQDAAATYRAFVAQDPVDEHAPALSMAAIEAYRKGGFPALMLQGKLDYVQHYGFSSAFWQAREHAAYPQVVEELKTNLKDVAQYYHVLAQKSHANADYADAARWYRAYLSSFPGEADSAATNYLLADALFESQQYAQAALEYQHTAYDYPNHKQAAEAGNEALIAYQKYEQTLPAPARAAVHLQAIDSGLRFAQRFPDNPASAGVLTRAAQDLYAAGDQARARATAQLLLAHAGIDRAQQRIGWSIVAQVSFNQADYPGAENAFTRALALVGSADPERADLTERLAASVYKQADKQRQAGNQLAAADDFLRVARVAPSSKIVEVAQYDAAAALIDAQQWQRAIPILEAYRRDFPRGQYIAGVSHKLAVAYSAAGQAGAAASEFERIAANPNEEGAVVHEALSKAAELYQQSGNNERAAAMLERLVRQFPTPIPDAIEVRERLLEIATHEGDATRTRYWQREIVTADAQAGSARTERTKYLAAQAQLSLAQPVRDEFRSIKLVAPLKRSLQEKSRALEEAVQAYKLVASYQVAETTTAATYETAELYHTLAQDLLASERPKRMSADELEQYQSLLEDQAYPFEEQAISIHELNAQRAQAGIYDDSVRKSMAALAQLLPARYGKTERSEVWIAALQAPAPRPATAAGAAAPVAAPPALTPPSTAKAAARAPKSRAGASSSAQPAAAASAPTSSVPTVPAPSAAALADFQRVTNLVNAGKAMDAQLELQQFQLRYPGYAAPAIDLGLLARRDNNLAAADTALRQATQLDPGSAVAWSELGVTLRAEGKFKDARSAYAQAIAQDSNYALAHRNLGVLLDLYLGEPASALPELERYKQLTGEDRPVSAWIADLRQRTAAKSAPVPATNPAGAGKPPLTGTTTTPAPPGAVGTATLSKAGRS